MFFHNPTRKNPLTAALLGALTAALLLTAASCGEKEPSYGDRETSPKETYETVENAGLSFQDALSRDSFADDSPVGEWLTGCASPDRDDQFAAYTLRRETASGENTTYEYLIYYPHGGSSLTATPEILEGGSGYVINVRYKAGGTAGSYSLAYLSVTIPSDEAPRLRLLLDEDPIGVMSTVTEDVILPGT